MRLTKIVVIMLAIVSVIGLSQMSFAAGEVKPEAPVILTTCGQSPGALMIRVVCKQAKVACEQKDNLTADDLKAKPYKTVIITTGTSLKGMGAAGVDINAEVARIQGVIAEARAQKMTVIGAHIEGMARRVDKTDEISIQSVIPVSDMLLVKEDSDSDGYFSKVATEKNIPIYIVKNIRDLVDIFKELFKVQ